MTGLSFAAVFLASLMGSAHCAGMCGGIVLYCAGNSPTRVAPQAIYHFGRLCSYALAGALAGLLGQSLNTWGSFAGIQQTAALLTGTLLVLWGVAALFGGSQLRFGQNALTKLSGFLSKAFQLKAGGRHAWLLRSYTIGFLSVFLPCGWLYAYLLVAAGTGGALYGTFAMIAFWAGTVPALALLGGVMRLMTERLRAAVPRVTAVLLIVAGLFSVLGREQLAPLVHLLSPSHGQHETHKQ